ncbi:MAG: MATE family efflux transporter [Bacteroidaceae bacterium]|nr:MATE family efflux transporter [Bacteroidaceae bacterium]
MNHRSRKAAIFTLAYPIVIAQLGTIVQGWADTIMVGQYGTPELSAASFVNNIFNLCIFFLLGISYATTPVVGTLFSQGKYLKVLSTLRESNVVNLLASLFIVLLLLILYLNLDHLGQPAELLPLIRSYFIVLLLSLPFLSLFNSMKQFSDALGDTCTPMWMMIGGNVINILLNYLFIFVCDMGLLGAGLATLIARVLMPLAMWLALHHGSLLRSLRSRVSSHSTFLAPRLLPLNFQLIKLGLPISIQLCLEASAFNISAIFMGWIGASALAAHQVMATVSSLAFMVYYGIGAAAAIRIAYFQGQNEWDEVRKTALTALWMSVASGVVLVSFLCIFGTSIAHIFTTSSEVAMLFLSFFPPFICYQIGDCLQITYANALRGIKDVRAMMLYAFIAYILVSLPLAYIFAFPFHMGAVGIWWSFPFGLTTAGLCYYFQFRKHYVRS